MTWLDVLKCMVLLFGVMCVVCVAISVYHDGKAKVAFIAKNGMYPSKYEMDRVDRS